MNGCEVSANHRAVSAYRRCGCKNPQAWQGFLSSACRNYKCRFDEQLLIYAQRPDAVAVAKLETWNRQFKRWVNKDSKGIAVFDPKGRRNTLKYYLICPTPTRATMAAALFRYGKWMSDTSRLLWKGSRTGLEMWKALTLLLL